MWMNAAENRERFQRFGFEKSMPKANFVSKILHPSIHHD